MFCRSVLPFSHQPRTESESLGTQRHGRQSEIDINDAKKTLWHESRRRWRLPARQSTQMDKSQDAQGPVAISAILFSCRNYGDPCWRDLLAHLRGHPAHVEDLAQIVLNHCFPDFIGVRAINNGTLLPPLYDICIIDDSTLLLIPSMSASILPRLSVPNTPIRSSTQLVVWHWN